MTYSIRSRDQHFFDPGPKRILSLDGGGLRGILTLGYLQCIETLLRSRVGGDPGFRLSHYFDLIAGTSTGAIIAAGLAKGMTVDAIVEQYMTMGRNVFRRNWFRQGVVRARYDEAKLSEQLRSVFGENTTLGSEDLQTGLLIVTKRLDSGSTWAIHNNPRGKFYAAKDDDEWIANSAYPLWQVVRASTAAPVYFEPERITVCAREGHEPVVGEFVDGGVSPFNDPALQAFMFATMDGHRLKWTPGSDNLLMISVGTGSPDPSRKPSKIAVEGAVKSLLSMMDDCASLVQTMMQWMSSSRTARSIDQVMGNLERDVIAQAPLLTYHRYDLSLTPDAVTPLKPALSSSRIEALSAMDDPDNLDILAELGMTAAERQLEAEDFPACFDLPIETAGRHPGLRAAGTRRAYRKKADNRVVAVQLALETDGFTYRKWGDDQTCKPGDWLVNNQDGTYTVDQETFSRTYRQVSQGVYTKVTPIWAEIAETDGMITTKEGTTQYRAGDYLVFNEPDGGDGYAVESQSFQAMYEPVP